MDANAGNFVADVRLDESDEVLQLPIVVSKLKKLLQSAVKKIALLGAPVIPSSDESLELFLQTAGKFFGKDPTRWDQMGEPQVEVTEDAGKRLIKSTGVFSGTELHLFVEEPHFDERLPMREDRPDLNFNEKRRAITTDAEWRAVIADQPWTASKRRQMLSAYLHAKLDAGDDLLAEEGCAGFWELSISKDNHADIRMDRLASLLSKLSSNNVPVATAAAAAVWGLATTAGMRRSMSDLDVVSLVVANLKKTLKMQVRPDVDSVSDSGAGEGEGGAVSESARAKLQRNLLGALALLLIDRFCRRPYLSMEGNLATLFECCKSLPGYPDSAQASRRETAAKVLTSLVQRDGDARKALIASGALRSVLMLLNPEGPGASMIQFCMASLLATLVLDDDAMELIRERGEAPILFESCIVLLTSTLDKLHAELDRRTTGYYQEGDTPEYDLYLGVRLAEASSQAMWGSAHYCVQMSPVQVKMEHVVELGKMGRDCVATDALPLSRVCHCVTATMATLASHPDTADLIMTCPNDIALSTLMLLVEVFETEVFERAGHVKASACAALAFLSCHPIGAEGDECMHGPYRRKLLEMGAFGALLRAALTSVMDPECDMIVQQAAAIGVMYLSTMAGAVDPAELAMYAALLMDSDNSEMIEFLMAGMWILLRNPDNRKVLGSSFNPNPASNIAKNMMHKLTDAITLHEIHDQAQEKAALIKQQVEAQKEAEQAAKDAKEKALMEGADVDEEGNIITSASPSPSPTPPRSATPTRASSTGQGANLDEGLGDGRGEGEGEAGEGAEEDVSSPRVSTHDLEPAPAQAEFKGGSMSELEDAAGVPAAGLGASTGAPGEDGENRPRGGGEEGGLHPGNPHGRDAVKREASTVVRGKLKTLDKRFDKQLKDNWGLETLVTVGESWLPAMLEQDEMGEATDIPVLKLFEFLVASICLFMIEDDVDPEPRELDLFKLTAPKVARGPGQATWWTVDARAPEPEPIVDQQLERALSILTQIVGMRLLAAWKSLQLGVLTLWNACARNGAMERHVVEHGVCARLLSIVNSPAWPPSLRDIAAGCLEFFMERASNLMSMPATPLPDGITWPRTEEPTQGLVPALMGHITLINSRLPLLEYRGCHGIARVCFAAPYGLTAEQGGEHQKEAKALAALLGGVDAIMALIKRVNRRYQDILAGRVSKPPTKRRSEFNNMTQAVAAAANGEAEDDSALYERDMTTIEAQQDVYFVAFAALLNISVLRTTQPMVAKKGLPILMGTSTLLYSCIANAKVRTLSTVNEEKLLHIVSAIIQNVALHPANRTRLYKMELMGSLALDKLIEQATEALEADEELRQTASLLPPLVPSPKQIPSPTRVHPPRASKRGSPVRHTRPPAVGPGIPVSSSKAPSSRFTRLSPNGQVLNASVDTALAGSVRPKVIFPPIVENKQDVWAGRFGDAAAPPAVGTHNSAAMRMLQANQRKSGMGGGMGSREQSPNAAMTMGSLGDSFSDAGFEDPSLLNDSRSRFLNWLDNTFAAADGGEAGGSSVGPSGTGGADKRTFRRQMWDEKGDWLEAEPESLKALNKLLCRPLSHLWSEFPEARAKHGQRRWEPAVSEYREMDGPSKSGGGAESSGPGGSALTTASHAAATVNGVNLSRAAARLLTTAPPKDQEGLMTAATQMMTQGKYDSLAVSQQVGEYELQRPSTRQREQGRMALTVLQPHPEVVLAAQQAADDLQEAAAQVAASGGSVDLDALKARLQSEAEAGSPGASLSTRPVPLKVVLGPQRSRQVISFEDRIITSDDPSRPTLTMFEHVEGSRVCKDLFPSYQLPNGRKAYMYYNSGVMLDEMSVDAVVPPPRPSTVPQALQQTMPLADVLNLIAKPPGSAPPFIPYKPVPYLVPLPPKHTLPVKRPDMLEASAFGDLREDNLQLIIVAKRIVKTQTNTRVEAVEVAVVEEREPWTLPMSIFKPRAKESDARTFHDNEQVMEKMFERDWARACGKEKFTSMMARENKSCKEPKDDKQMLNEVHDVLLEYYQLWFSAFMYFAAMGSNDPYHMPLNAYTTFLDESMIADSDSQFIKRSDCDTIFIVCNFQPDKKSAEAAVNVENAMMRYEFLESLVRAGIAKYGKGQATDDVATAVRMLLEQNLDANMPPAARHRANDFRNERLYTEEVDLVLKRHQVVLKALYSRYRLKPPGGGLRTKSVKLEGWLQFMQDASLIDSQFTLQDANLAFLWSRMAVLDEIKDYGRYTSLTFVDFLEALGRVADMKSLPLDSDLDSAGYNNILEWALDKERMEGNPDNKAGQSGTPVPGDDGDMVSSSHHADIFKARESAGFDAPKNRPLYVKLELLLDLIFRRIYYDPTNPDLPFNYDGLLKLIKKMDKDLGP